ncbi:MAG: CoA-binding protein [Candidatus Manganitrophus sp.]|nr:MAG: CoA-binding protein [Candidatus Manganitrophus sp.]
MEEEKKIAIVGASRNRAKFGNKAVRAFMEKGYHVFPVHPSEKEIEGRPVYRSVLEIPDQVALASFYIPSLIGLKVIEEVAQKEGMRIVYLNPGSESEELIRKGRALGLEIRDTCSIVAIGADPSRY